MACFVCNLVWFKLGTYHLPTCHQWLERTRDARLPVTIVQCLSSERKRQTVVNWPSAATAPGHRLRRSERTRARTMSSYAQGLMIQESFYTGLSELYFCPQNHLQASASQTPDTHIRHSELGSGFWSHDSRSLTGLWSQYGTESVFLRGTIRNIFLAIKQMARCF